MTQNLFLAAEGESLKNVVDSLVQVFGMSLWPCLSTEGQ